MMNHPYTSNLRKHQEQDYYSTASGPALDSRFLTHEDKIRIHLRPVANTSEAVIVVFNPCKAFTTSKEIDSEANKHLISKITSFQALDSEWDGYHGKKPSNQAIEDAIAIVKSLPNKALPTRAGISGDGEICLIWEDNSLFADIGVFGEGKYSYFIKSGKKKFYGDDIPITQELPDDVLEILGT